MRLPSLISALSRLQPRLPLNGAGNHVTADEYDSALASLTFIAADDDLLAAAEAEGLAAANPNKHPEAASL